MSDDEKTEKDIRETGRVALAYKFDQLILDLPHCSLVIYREPEIHFVQSGRFHGVEDLEDQFPSILSP